MILPVIRVMRAIGYGKALVVYGTIDGSEKGMDEASVCGWFWTKASMVPTRLMLFCVALDDGQVPGIGVGQSVGVQVEHVAFSSQGYRVTREEGTKS
jgi:hypothetical protein